MLHDFGIRDQNELISSHFSKIDQFSIPFYEAVAKNPN